MLDQEQKTNYTTIVFFNLIKKKKIRPTSSPVQLVPHKTLTQKKNTASTPDRRVYADDSTNR
jgi:hypothetical protein